MLSGTMPSRLFGTSMRWLAIPISPKGYFRFIVHFEACESKIEGGSGEVVGLWREFAMLMRRPRAAGPSVDIDVVMRWWGCGEAVPEGREGYLGVLGGGRRGLVEIGVGQAGYEGRVRWYCHEQKLSAKKKEIAA